MATVTFKGDTVNTNGSLPKTGEKAPCFRLVKSDLSDLSCCDLKGFAFRTIALLHGRRYR